MALDGEKLKNSSVVSLPGKTKKLENEDNHRSIIKLYNY